MHSKEQLMIILDIGAPMAEGVTGAAGRSAFELARQAAVDIVNRKMLLNSKEPVGIILVGSEDTNNNVYEEGSERYAHISLARDLTPPDFEVMLFLRNELKLNLNDSGDIIDAVVVAMDSLVRSVAKKKQDKRIVVITDGRSPILNDRGSFESICEGLKAHGFILQVIDCLSLSGVQSAEAVSSETPQTEAMKSLHEMADTVADGSVFAIDDALEAMVFVEKRTRQTVYYRGALDIAGKVKIPVEAYMRTNSQKYPSFFKYSVLSEDDANAGRGNQHDQVRAIRETTMSKESEGQADGDDDEDMQEQEVIEGYRFGKVYVPLEKNADSFPTSSGLSVLQFTPRNDIPRFHFMSSVAAVVPRNDPNAVRAFDAFVRALKRDKKVALARFVYRQGLDARLVILIPHIKEHYHSLLMVKVPFADDIRFYSFPDFTHDRSNISTSQRNAVKSLVESMKLDDVDLGRGERGEGVQPKHIPNPGLQHLFKVVEHRVFQPDQPLAPLAEPLKAMLERNPEIQERARESLKRVRDEFPLEVNEQGVKRAAAGATGSAGAVSSGAAWNTTMLANDEASKMGASVSGSAGLALASMGGGDGAMVTDVGANTPIQDFNAMMNSDGDLHHKAIEGIGRVLRGIVEDSYGQAQAYNKALECVRAMRKGCISVEMSALFNIFLETLKADYEFKDREDFWKMVVGDGITLISTDESEDSTVSRDTALAFVATGEMAHGQLASTAEDAAGGDDLLDDMD